MGTMRTSRSSELGLHAPLAPISSLTKERPTVLSVIGDKLPRGSQIHHHLIHHFCLKDSTYDLRLLIV